MEEEEEGPDGPARKKQNRGKSAEKKAHDKQHQYSPVQVKLNTFLQPEFAQEMSELLEGVALVLNVMVFHAYQLANFHFIRLLTAGQPLPVPDQKFYYQCLSLVSNGGHQGTGEEELRESNAIYYSLLPVEYEKPSSRYLPLSMALLSKKMETMAKNHFTANTFNHIVVYAWHRYQLANKVAAEFFVKSCFFPDRTQDDLSPQQREFKAWIEINPSFPEIVEANMQHFAQKLFNVARYFEEQHELDRRRSEADKAARRASDRILGRKTPRLTLFTVLPQKGSYIPSFYDVTKSTLPGLLSLLDKLHRIRILRSMLDAPPVPNDPYPLTPEDRTFLENRLNSTAKPTLADPAFHQNEAIARKLWSVLFNFRKFETARRKFNFAFSTNGCAVSIQLQKPKDDGPDTWEGVDENFEASTDRKEYDNPAALRMEDFDCFVGVDPGESSQVAFRGELKLVKGKVRSVYAQVSTKEMHHNSKVHQATAWRRNFQKRHPGYSQAILALRTVKTADYAQLQANIQANSLLEPVIFEKSNLKVHRARQFKTYRFDQKAMVQAVRKVIGPNADPSRTVIGWGHWDNAKKAPVRKLRRACRAAGIKVIRIWEYLTSKRCSQCCSVAHKNRNVYYGSVRCHQVIRCTNSECEEVWQRDLNGARNIRNILLARLNGEIRPVYLEPEAHPPVEVVE